MHLHLNAEKIIILHEQLDRVIIRGLGVKNFIDPATIEHNVSEYIAPEQISFSDEQEQIIDERADIYSYGCLLYYLLAGRTPFKASTNEELINKHLKEMPESISNIRKDVPLALSQLVEKCLEKKSTNRYSSFIEILENLKNIKESYQKLSIQYISEEYKSIWWKWLLWLLSAILLGIYFFYQLPCFI